MATATAAAKTRKRTHRTRQRLVRDIGLSDLKPRSIALLSRGSNLLLD